MSLGSMGPSYPLQDRFMVLSNSFSSALDWDTTWNRDTGCGQGAGGSNLRS